MAKIKRNKGSSSRFSIRVRSGLDTASGSLCSPDKWASLSCGKLDTAARLWAQTTMDLVWLLQVDTYGDEQMERKMYVCQELLGKVFDSIPEEAKKVNLVIVTHLSKVESEMSFMDHHDGYRLAESSHRNHHRLQTRLRTTLMQIFYCLGLQAGYGMQGGGSLPSSTASLRH